MRDMHEHNRKKIGWTILLNLIITVAEYIGGTLSGSLALISDAGHNFADVISLILGYAGERASGREATEKHSFGFKRAEIFTALVNALALWAIGIFIVSEALGRLNSHESISIWLMVGVAVIGLFGNVFSLFVLGKDKNASLNMKAAYAHLFYDAISSVAVIASAIAIYFTGWAALDLVASIFIAAMVFWSGFEVIKSAIHILMQGVPVDIELDEVYNTIMAIKGVREAHSLHIWSINSNEAFLSCHIVMKSANKDADRVIADINRSLKEKYRISHTVIQAERKALCPPGKICPK